MKLYKLIEIATGTEVGDVLIESEERPAVLSQTHRLQLVKNNVTLENLLRYYKREVDRFTGDIRERYISGGSGQQLTYIKKEAQARAFKQGNYTGAEADFPWIFKEASSTALTPRQVANKILLKARNLEDYGSTIEAQRQRAHKKIAEATTPEEAKTEFDVAITALNTNEGE